MTGSIDVWRVMVTFVRCFGWFAIANGVAARLLPKVYFFLGEGWKFRDARPSRLSLNVTRVAGLASVAIGVGLLVALHRMFG